MAARPYPQAGRAACYKLCVRREFSAGGVVVRRLRGRWWLAAIRPAGKPGGTWGLPEGLIASGDSGEATARREAAEAPGGEGTSLGKLGDLRHLAGWEGAEGVN